ncbi:membrane protein insertase [Actibacterium atlanticum]|uniref:Membrane protein insertase YidC n=1 Tax=Actibacterium atlanticum TaxID=1461693 RepID=A0A058ZMM3_9RHOB|nr:membrane protein insertase YidC [Actibacterium atlanticum]KCV82768.1 membrane protein insertase [Actibacterium atlanticum]
MDDQNKNLILASVLSFVVILVWFLLFPPEEPQQLTPEQAAAEGNLLPPAADAPVAQAATTAEPAPQPAQTAARIDIDTPRLAGSISTMGGRIDTLSLKDYRQTLAEDSDTVQVLKPQSADYAYFALYGWAPGGDLGFEDVPGANTIWTVESGASLTTSTPVILRWDNDKGLTFRRTISVDENFMLSVTQSVRNNSAAGARLAPYGRIERHGEPDDLKGFFIIHEGAIRQTGEELTELNYKKLRKLDNDARWGANADVEEVAGNGWIGFTDHYWMTTLIPQNDQPFTSVMKYNSAQDIYLTEARMPTVDLAAGASAEVTTRLFAGAKEWETIKSYEAEDGIYNFVNSIDWGWFSFLTKPIFRLLHMLNGMIGNMGWAIIALTLIIKAVLFPLAYKSYVSMAKMKELQPEMEKIKERTGDDRQKLQQEMMQLYKKEKVNPASGCLPILLQIPIFFSLYKVIFVTIELRHAEWIGWIKDLSSPDPSSILNLFGLLPFATPGPESIFAIVSLGVLPILLGISMYLQQKLNPAPTDPTQKMIFAWMPWVFMFMLGSFASGLVVYWIANNTITFIQQYTIMRSQGYKPDVLGNITSGLKRSSKEDK